MFVSSYPLALVAMAGLFRVPRVYARRMLIGGCASGRVFALLAMLMLSLEAVSAASGGSNGTRGTVLAITSCADDGPGTLREALATAPPAVIEVSQLPCPDRTIALTSGEIAFDNDGELTITGIQAPGPSGVTIIRTIIDGGGASRIFTQHGAGLLTLTAIELRNGHSAGPGGCLQSEGDLALNVSIVDGCSVVATDFGNGVGGGVYVAGGLTIVESLISGNSATADAFVEGGGAWAGRLDLNYSTVSNNSAIATSAFGFGGGLYVNGNADIVNSTISGNQATDIGGIELLGADGTATLRIADSTISGNEGAGTGGLLALQSPVTIASSTIAFNTATTDSGIGGLALGNSSTLESTLLANNVGLDAGQSCVTPPCGLAIDGANNLIVTTDMPVPADTMMDDPLLLPLADNGGPTETHALASASPAIDRGNAIGAGTGTLGYDQRGPGYVRVIGVAADIGAYEIGSGPEVIFVDGFDCIESGRTRDPQICP